MSSPRETGKSEFLDDEEATIEKKISNIIRYHPPGKRYESECKVIARWLLDVEHVNVRPSRRIFEKMPIAVLWEVAQYITLQSYDTSELIFLQSETGVSYYVILMGGVDIYDADMNRINRDLHMHYVDGKIRQELDGIKKEANTDSEAPSKQLGAVVIKSKLLTSLSAGNTFGEIALLTERTVRTASAVASQYTELIMINKPLYDRTIKKYQNSSLDFEEKLKFLPHVDVFSDWGSSRWNHLAYWLEEIEFPRGAVIIQEGTKGKYIGLIREGDCKLVCKSPKDSVHNGNDIDLSLIGMYNIIGEGSILACETIRNYSVIAQTHVKLFIIREHSFKRLNNLSKGTETITKIQSIWDERQEFIKARTEICSPAKSSVNMSFVQKLHKEGKIQLDYECDDYGNIVDYNSSIASTTTNNNNTSSINSPLKQTENSPSKFSLPPLNLNNNDESVSFARSVPSSPIKTSGNGTVPKPPLSPKAQSARLASSARKVLFYYYYYYY